MIEDRTLKKITGDEDDKLGVVVRTAAGQAFPGEVVTGSPKSVETLFARCNAPMLALGQQATLTFTSTRHEPYEVRATTDHRSELGGFRRYHFQFEKSKELTPHLVRLFNQRRAFRVDADSLEPVEVVMESASGLRASGRMRTLSSMGIGFLGPEKADSDFAAVEQVQVLFTLPSCEKELYLAAWIRNRVRPMHKKIISIKTC